MKRLRSLVHFAAWAGVVSYLPHTDGFVFVPNLDQSGSAGSSHFAQSAPRRSLTTLSSTGSDDCGRDKCAACYDFDCKRPSLQGGRREFVAAITANGVLSTFAATAKVGTANALDGDTLSAGVSLASTDVRSAYGTGCATDPEERRIEVFEKASPSVVFIDTFIEQRDAFSPNVMEVPTGAGSGFIWDDSGHIVTNYHVVRNSAKAQVAIITKSAPEDGVGTMSSPSPSKAVRARAKQGVGQDPAAFRSSMRPNSQGTGMAGYTRKIYNAKVVGVDPGKDIAVLKVDAMVSDLSPIDIGESSGLRVGQGVLAIGNPFGLDHTLTSGIISGLGREIKSPAGRPISNVIQTDAAINPGNSGGPLLEAKTGRLIGMSTAIFSTTGSSAGIGFAIPIDSVKYIANTLIRDGRVIRPVLGVSLLESKQAKALGISRGVLVLDVPTGSPAFKSGMKGTTRTETGLIEIGDVIVKIDDKTVDSESDLFQALETYKPGDRIQVKVNRPEPESRTSSRIKLKEVALSIQLTSSELAKDFNFKNNQK